ncbi:HlyD family efflux transporter periplasmic adaptor subunit [Thalassotalea sp. M1531]|uniref:HlyD family efflux transporter periplasmic adaptor subunit n=1 Tax=Thalassotalea algicola TaxID=2716224 RepID=A0A7Y0LCQ0_9GAMM|nr:HlyD family efflux transporter periplasmic adaptor subunit [Thalassotalea algicola]NMP30685.1 HlyD family efflux transporter periplasmic adaptor subunit [Thalassotalea algicola]
MDIVREKKVSFFTKYRLPIAIGVISMAIFGFSQAIVTSDYAADKSMLRIATVKRGELAVKVRGPGVLTPKNIRWIASDVEGRAERVLVKPGAIVKAGELLVELTNPKLERQLEESRWELTAQEAEAKAETTSLASLLLDQEARVLNAELDYESNAMRLRAETELFDKGAQAVSKLDYEKTKLATKQSSKRWQIEQQRLIKMQENIDAQATARAARLNKMRKSYEIMEQQVENLEIRASIDSVVQDVAIEAGQQVTMGSSLAKLARQDELIAELQIPELAIRDVALGQKVVIDTRNNQIDGEVIRIAPSVDKGSVQVDVALIQPLPNDARPDLSIDGEIIIAQLSDVMHVRRPPFVQSNRTATVFKLATDGSIAERINVDFGLGSVQHIEIKRGLNVGEQIIVSQNEELDRFNKISLN